MGHKSVNAQACQKLDESLYDFEIHSHVAPKPAVARITYSQSINAYLIWDMARSEFGPGPDLIWVQDPNRFRPSANPISTLPVISVEMQPTIVTAGKRYKKMKILES